MKKLFAVTSVLGISLSLAACDAGRTAANDCALAKQSISLEQATEVVKAAGLEVVRPTPHVVAPAPVPEDTPPRRFTLLCAANVSGQRITQTLLIDLDTRTVNGVAASVGEDEIKWSTRYTDAYHQGSMVQSHTFNRINGDYRSYVNGFLYSAPPPTFACSVAPKKIF